MNLKIAGLSLVALLLTSMAVAATASATTPVWEACVKGAAGTKYAKGEHEQCEEASGAGEWGWSEIKNTEKAVAVGSLTLIDESAVTVEVGCTVKSEGSIGPGKYSRSEKPTYECTAGKNCEKFEKIEAKHLPWQEELYETESKTFTKTTDEKGEKEPPILSVTCKVLGVSVTDEINIEKVQEPVADARTFRLSTLSYELLVLIDPNDPRSAKGSLAWLRANAAGVRVS